MLESFITAAVITAGIIIGLGPQNVFVIKQGIRGHYIWLVVLICELCEIITVSAGAMGAGFLFEQHGGLQKILGLAGISFLLYYGFQSFRAAFAKHERVEIARQHISLREIIVTSLSISLLNPWALMDTMVIIGGAAAQKDTAELTLAFMLGSWTVSTLWFLAIGYGAQKFQIVLSTERANRSLDLIAGSVMWIGAIGLGVMFFG